MTRAAAAPRLLQCTLLRAQRAGAGQANSAACAFCRTRCSLRCRAGWRRLPRCRRWPRRCVPSATGLPSRPSPRRRCAATPQSRAAAGASPVSIVRCCIPCAAWPAASRSPSSPSARRRPPAPAQVRRRRKLSEPARVELRAAFPGHDITVLNRGVNGEETENMMARFADRRHRRASATRALAGRHQFGAARSSARPACRAAARRHRAAQGDRRRRGADRSCNMRRRCSPSRRRTGMVDQIALAAKDENVDLFRRFAVMRNWHEVQHISFERFVSPDRLHMNDWGYACVAKLLGRRDRRSRDAPGRVGRGASGASKAASALRPPPAPRARPPRYRRDVRARPRRAPARR